LSPKDASQGGVMFKTAFASHDIFDGTVEHSTHALVKATLKKNMTKHQVAIDFAFPRNQARFVVANNAVFLDILQRGYNQAVAMFDSITPPTD